MVRVPSLPLVAALAFVCLVAVAPVQAASKDLHVDLKAAKTELTTSEDVRIRFVLHNRGELDRSVYLWATPLVEVEGNLFDVKRDGTRVAFLGYIAKRGLPTRTDFVAVRPGKSRGVDVELSALYDMSQPGSYTVRYRNLPSNELSLQITGEPRSSGLTDEMIAEIAAGPGASANTFVKCSASQQSDLNQARPAAANYSSSAYSSLTGTAGQRYTTWFGTYTSGRYSTVKSHYNSLSSALGTANYTFNCGCKKNYYAYVYPTRPYEVFLCRAFWTAPLTGTDSKAGTLVHETSHFNVVASTDDWAYGQSACKSLAISNPDNAVDNADSHEYYAENTPPLN